MPGKVNHQALPRCQHVLLGLKWCPINDVNKLALLNIGNKSTSVSQICIVYVLCKNISY